MSIKQHYRLLTFYHFVDIVDYSQEMLSDIQPQERVAAHLADIRNISSLFPDSHFDLIMCHNVLQYISDVPALIESFSKLLSNYLKRHFEPVCGTRA